MIIHTTGQPAVVKVQDTFTDLIGIYFSGTTGTLKIEEKGKLIFQISTPDYGFIPFNYQTKNELVITLTPDTAADISLNVHVL